MLFSKVNYLHTSKTDHTYTLITFDGGDVPTGTPLIPKKLNS